MRDDLSSRFIGFLRFVFRLQSQKEFLATIKLYSGRSGWPYNNGELQYVKPANWEVQTAAAAQYRGIYLLEVKYRYEKRNSEI